MGSRRQEQNCASSGKADLFGLSDPYCVLKWGAARPPLPSAPPPRRSSSRDGSRASSRARSSPGTAIEIVTDKDDAAAAPEGGVSAADNIRVAAAGRGFARTPTLHQTLNPVWCDQNDAASSAADSGNGGGSFRVRVLEHATPDLVIEASVRMTACMWVCRVRTEVCDQDAIE